MRIVSLLAALLLLGCSGASSESRTETTPTEAETESETESDTATTEAEPATEGGACEASSDCAPDYTCTEGTCTRPQKVLTIEEREYDFADDSIDGDLVKPDSESIETEGAVDDM
jgi:hypothetical protein